jgi:hypothetical protein
LTQIGQSRAKIQQRAASPDLMLANPLSLPLLGLGQRMQFGQRKRREFIERRPSPIPGMSILVIPPAD